MGMVTIGLVTDMDTVMDIEVDMDTVMVSAMVIDMATDMDMATVVVVMAVDGANNL